MNASQGEQEPARGVSPFGETVVSRDGGRVPDHDEQPPGADDKSVRAGHEPDVFGVKGILMVPAFVAVVLLLTYGMVSVVFWALRDRENRAADLADNSQVKEVNQLPVNDRFARFSSTQPKPVDEARPDTKVAQPRLEYLKQTGEEPEKTKDGHDAQYVRSKRAYQTGNPPEIRPEDLRPENYVDPVTGQKVLVQAALVVTPDTEPQVARIPIADAMRLAVADPKYRLPAKPARLPVTSDGAAKLSNGGWGGYQLQRVQTTDVGAIRPDGIERDAHK